MIRSAATGAWQWAMTSFRRALGPVWRNLGPLIGLEIVFGTVVFVLVGPALAAATSSLIASHGTVAVSNFEIVAFLLSPAGLALIAVTAIATVLGVYVHLGSIALVAIGAERERRVTMLGAFLGTLRRLPQLLGAAAIGLGVVVLCIAPLAGLGALAFAKLMTGHDIYFYLSTRPPAFWLMGGIAAVLGAVATAILLTLSVRWFFTPLTVLIEGHGPRAAMRRSAELARPVWRGILGVIIAWLVAILMLSVAVSVGLWGLDRLGFLIAGQSTGRLLAIIGTLLVLRFASAIVISFFAQASLGFLAAYLYLDRAKPTDLGVLAGSERQSRFVMPPRRAGVIVAIGAVVLVGLTVWTCFALADRMELEQRTLIVAHRGSSLRAPENTLAAIEAAIDDGAEVVEIDVQETADGQIVVLHDKDLTRVTGVGRNIWEITLEEIRTLEAGSWFASEFEGERIPTLEEVLDRCRGRIRVLIELKYNGHDVALADRVLDIVEAKDVGGEVLFMSLEMRGLEEVKARRPDIPCGLTVGSSIGDIARLDLDFVAIGQRQLTQFTYDALLDADIQIWVWTVNDRGGMVRFLARDIEGLITDDPAAASSIRRELDTLDTSERLILAFRYRLPF